MEIIKAEAYHISLITPLFDQYRIFYKQESNIIAAENFLKERMLKGESTLFLAIEEKEGIGFVQLYRSFSSVSMKPIFILNDLYVSDEHRGKGVGEALLNRSKQYCKEKKFMGLALETAIDNPAQHLYEKLNWKKDTDCFHYFWTAK